MGEELNSESTSTISDDWVKEGGVSISSLPTEFSKEMSSSSVVSFVSEVDNKKMLWVRLLGVFNRPNPLDDWDQLYNLNNQIGLRNDCRKLAILLDNKKSVPELESFMTLYCKKRNVDYKKDIGWLVILEKIIRLDLPGEHLFNVFFAFTTKYIPRETRENAQIYDLFRLLLQYHDPQISSHLDSLKCDPYSYANQWFSTMLAASVHDDVCRTLWELYIEKGDPFLIFYMAIVLIVNARDQLLDINLSGRDMALKTLVSLPNQLTVDDIPDFVQLSVFYADRTPQCVREDLHYLIFGSNYDDDAGEIQMSKLLCLPLAARELIRKEPRATCNITYFVIDCRSNEAYKNGHIYGSFNLDCKLMVDEPDQFEMALACLQSFKHDQKLDEHICFLGYGENDMDQFMNMVIARFLQDGKSHVTFAQSGYRGLHSALLESNRLRLINSHNKLKCQECKNGTAVSSWKLVGKMKEVVLSKSSAVKGKVSELVAQATPAHALSTEVKHVASSDRYGKRYRNEPSIFSIDDDSSDENCGSVSNKLGGKEELRLAEQAEFIEHFPCHELNDDKKLVSSHIAITRTHIHVLRDVLEKPGYVTTEARHPLSSVLRVTSKKKIPELLTFKFGYETRGIPKFTAIHRFIVPKAGECAKSVKTAIFALRPLMTMQVNTEDITVNWGQQPHPLDSTYGKWRLALFQDLQESIDTSKLYFLYDPIADEKCGTRLRRLDTFCKFGMRSSTLFGVFRLYSKSHLLIGSVNLSKGLESGTRKGYPGLVIFDVNIKCFVGEIPLHAQGTMKFLFSLKCPSPQGGSAFVLVTEEQNYGQIRLHLFRLDLSGDGLSVTNCRPLLNTPLVIGGEYICSMREDAPEIVVMANPGLQVWRINAIADQPQEPSTNFTVPGADLTHFYDGFLSNGSVHLLSSSPDGHLDHSRVHVLNLSSAGQITTHTCTPDPQRGMPLPRKNAGIDGVANAILLAGGEIDHGNYNVQRLVDYWMLDTKTFQWLQIPAQMPVPLIEPRLTSCNSGNIYLWGDFDQPLPGMPQGGTHLRIMRVSGMDKAGHPPSYNQIVNQPPTYPSPSPAPYPQAGVAAPPYPAYNPTQTNPSFATPNYPSLQQHDGGFRGGSFGQPNLGSSFQQVPAGPNQTAYYPPQKSKKDCSIQ
ncbi:kelch repeat protein [Dictyocaulus viviparus]|uniref:TBC1 domain family member 23 n=1 Tax=Dictyocaulus viviparus TaxID=29172 RepID=A0A0D8XL89_DICVI|nr:kelch repeat protein [Dictyocaulus viviparus]